MPDFIFRFPIKLEDLKSLSGASDSYRVIDSFGPLEIVQIVTGKLILNC